MYTHWQSARYDNMKAMKALSYNAMYRGKLKEITAKIKAGENNKKVTGRR